MSRAFKTIREWLGLAGPIAVIVGVVVWTGDWSHITYLALWWGLVLLFIAFPSLRDDEFGNQALLVASAGVALVAAAALIAVYVVEDLLLFALLGGGLLVAFGVGAAWERLKGDDEGGDQDSSRIPPAGSIAHDVEERQRRRDAEITKIYPHV